jgi:hypothetical protein
MAEIHLQGVSKVFDKTVAVDNVELHIEDGEFMVLSVRAAAARRRCCACWPAWSTPTVAGSGSATPT